MADMQYRAFVDDKLTFFEEVDSIDQAGVRAAKQNYKFLTTHRSLIGEEFRQLFALLEKDGENRDKFWLYCYYCSQMLAAYYQGYGKFDEAKKYRDYSSRIQQYANGSNQKVAGPSEAATETFIRSLQQHIGASIVELTAVPQHTSKIRDWLSITNITRIQIVFCRLTVKQSLLVAQNLHWLEKFERFTGTHIDVNAMVSVLDSPTGLFNILSVGIFVARFMINAGMLLKHTFMPSEAETDLSLSERFNNELNKRHCDLLNDVVWGSVNGLTNYAQYFNIAAPTASCILAGFLGFDVAMMMYRRHLAENDYLSKRTQYNYELAQLPDDAYEKMTMLQAQLAALDLSWQVTNATCWFNVTAAALLMSGFSASLMLTTPVVAPVCFLVGAIAVSMYLSADLYGSYHEKSLLKEIDPDNGDALQAVSEARNELLLSMAKNTFMPILFLTTVAVSLPAALVLTTLYIGYQCAPAAPKLPSSPTAPYLMVVEDELGALTSRM